MNPFACLLDIVNAEAMKYGNPLLTLDDLPECDRDRYTRLAQAFIDWM